MKGKRVSLTDKQVEKEIERLSGSEAVALARQEKRVKYKRRQSGMSTEAEKAEK